MSIAHCMMVMILLATATVPSKSDTFRKITVQAKTTVFEHMSNGSIVANVNDQIRLYGVQSVHSFRLIPQGDIEKLISVDHETGDIQVIGSIDHESLCRSSSHYCIFQIQIRAKSFDSHYLILMPIEIADINDNAPLFPSSIGTYEINITENVQNDFKVRLPSAYDPDSNSITTYHFSKGNDDDDDLPFELVLENREPFLRICKPIDFEVRRSYNFNLKACDHLIQQCAQLPIVLRVMDVNDNPPRFDSRNLIVHPPHPCITRISPSIDESVPIGSTIGKVKAEDRDLNAALKYRIRAQSANPFHIDGSSGLLSTIGYLDAEKVSAYEFDVVVEDKDGMSDECRVTVNVSDVDDNRSELKFYPLHENCMRNHTQYVCEYDRLINDTRLGTISVSDADVSAIKYGVNASLHDSSARLFELIRFDGKGGASEKNPRKHESYFMLKLRISYFQSMFQGDTGDPIERIQCAIKIQSDDIHLLTFAFNYSNRANPVFFKSAYEFEFSIERLASIVTKRLPLAKVKASDVDGSDDIVYFIIDAKHSLFTVDAKSGEIFARRPLALTASEHSVQIRAHDGKRLLPTRYSSIVRVRFRVLSSAINDFGYSIAKSGSMHALKWEFNVNENFVGRFGRLFTGPLNSRLIGVGSDSFSIDHKTNVYVKRRLDREKRAFYYLSVRSSRESEEMWLLIVNVVDVNDNSPVIDHPRPNANFYFTQLNVGEILLKVVAHDEDEGLNAAMLYRIVSGGSMKSGAGSFRIEKDGTIVSSVNRSEKMCVVEYVEVIVSDSGTPSLSSVVGFYMHVSSRKISGNFNLSANNRLLVTTTTTSFLILISISSLSLIVAVLICRSRNRPTIRLYDDDGQAIPKKSLLRKSQLLHHHVSNTKYAGSLREGVTADEGISFASSLTSKPTEEDFLRSSGDVSRNTYTQSNPSVSPVVDYIVKIHHNSPYSPPHNEHDAVMTLI